MGLENLKQAIKDKNIKSVRRELKKINPDLLNKDILKLAINSKNLRIVRSIAYKTKNVCFDKEILLDSIKTRNGGIAYIVASKSNPDLFTRDVVEVALQIQAPNVVRAIVDHTTDKNIFYNYKDQIQKAILRKKDVNNLVGQILSLKDNASFDREMQELVLDIYLDVIKNNISKSEVKFFNFKEFEDCIKESRSFISNPKSINLSSLDNKDKFLLLPIYAESHAFSGIVRKLDDNKFSITLVNLGARPFEMNGKDNQYKEFVLDEKSAVKILKQHSFNIRTSTKKELDTDGVYRRFSRAASEEYTLNVTSRDQKMGNCFLKNIEKGINFALSIGLSKAENNKFSTDSLRISIEGEEKYKTKFLKPIHKMRDKTNDLTTIQLRKELVDQLTARFPEYSESIQKQWKTYEKRKQNHNIIDRRRFKRKNDYKVQYHCQSILEPKKSNKEDKNLTM